MARNHRSTMEALFKAKAVYMDEECKVLAEPEYLVDVKTLASESPIPLSNDVYTVWDLIAQYLDFHAMVSQNILVTLSKYTKDEKHANDLKNLGDPKNVEQFKAKFLNAAIIDVFRVYQTLRLPINRLMEVIPPMRHRLYSIASSPKLVGAQTLELIITDVNWDVTDPADGMKRSQRGLTTGFLYETSNNLGNYSHPYLDRNGMFPA